MLLVLLVQLACKVPQASKAPLVCKEPQEYKVLLVLLVPLECKVLQAFKEQQVPLAQAFLASIVFGCLQFPCGHK